MGQEWRFVLAGDAAQAKGGQRVGGDQRAGRGVYVGLLLEDRRNFRRLHLLRLDVFLQVATAEGRQEGRGRARRWRARAVGRQDVRVHPCRRDVVGGEG